MRDLKESDIQKSILDYLKIKHYVIFKHRSVGIYKQDTGKYIPLAFGEKGISDLIACDPYGRFWAIEVKKPGGRPSQEQLDFLSRVRENNGVALLVDSLDQVLAYVESYLADSLIAYTKPPVQDTSVLKLKGQKSRLANNPFRQATA